MTRTELAKRVYQEHATDGCTFEELRLKYAEHYQGRKPEPTRGWIARLYKVGQCPPARPFTPPAEHVYTGQPAAISLPLYTGAPVITGNVIAIGDVHLPTTNWELAERVAQVARKSGIKTLAIIGDWLNCDLFSKYDPLVPNIPFSVELEYSVRLMAHYAETFEHIYFAMGNHEARYLKLLKGDVTCDLFSRLLGAAHGRLQMTTYGYMDVISAGIRWHLTHPRNYSRIKGALGTRLAEKEHCNVVVFHQHHVAKLMDTWGRYVIIDAGGLFDETKMAYVRLVDSIMPTMNNGFVVIRDGIGELLTPYPAYTDWRQWI